MTLLNATSAEIQKPALRELFVAVHAHNTKEVLVLLERGVDPNEKGQYGHTALITAAARGYTDLVSLLIERGAALDVQNNFGYTALISAVQEGSADVVQLLIENGAAPDKAKKSGGNTALMEAVVIGRTDIVRMLIDGLADIDKKNEFGNTALVLAEHGNHEEIIQMLKEAPAIQEKIIQDIAEANKNKAMHDKAVSKQKQLPKIKLKF